MPNDEKPHRLIVGGIAQALLRLKTAEHVALLASQTLTLSTSL